MTAKAQQPALEALNIRVEIGGARLLDDVSLALRPGCVTCLLGPNGAGKSTLLRVLSGALQPSRGEVRFGGRPLGDWPARDLARRRAVLSQSTSLGFAFTVAEVTALGRSPHRRSSSAAIDRRIIEAAMAAADVGHLARRHYPTLSGGEQQRGQLARVLAQLMDGSDRFDGKLLLLDEPTSSLDLAHQQQVLAIAAAVARAGGSVLAILHDLNLAAAVADEIGLMRAGRLIALGTPTDVLTADTIKAVFAIEAAILDHPNAAQPLVAPLHPADLPCLQINAPMF
ncbi:MAG: heme ABC transporter ATP-binding protein [Alphaproteobacteria bacterium]